MINFLVRAQKTLLGALSGAEFFTGTLDIDTALELAMYLANEPDFNRDLCDALQRRVDA